MENEFSYYQLLIISHMESQSWANAIVVLSGPWSIKLHAWKAFNTLQQGKWPKKHIHCEEMFVTNESGWKYACIVSFDKDQRQKANPIELLRLYVYFITFCQ